jgi:hypothetical protein
MFPKPLHYSPPLDGNFVITNVFTIGIVEVPSTTVTLTLPLVILAISEAERVVFQMLRSSGNGLDMGLETMLLVLEKLAPEEVTVSALKNSRVTELETAGIYRSFRSL